MTTFDVNGVAYDEPGLRALARQRHALACEIVAGLDAPKPAAKTSRRTATVDEEDTTGGDTEGADA